MDNEADSQELLKHLLEMPSSGRSYIFKLLPVSLKEGAALQSLRSLAKVRGGQDLQSIQAGMDSNFLVNLDDMLQLENDRRARIFLRLDAAEKQALALGAFDILASTRGVQGLQGTLHCPRHEPV